MSAWDGSNTMMTPGEYRPGTPQSGSGFNVPVAIFAFNRPDLTKRVHDVISQLRPRSLFLIADGPRSHQTGDQDLCNRVRRILLNIDWDCTFETDFSSYNMGCGRRMSSGLDWLFDQVESAIILEDDCLPSPEFFYFCREMLDYFRNDTRVGTIAGTNIAATYESFAPSYLLSRYPQAWGWATWRRSWQHYDFDLLQLDRVKESGFLAAALGSSKLEKFWLERLDEVRAGTVDTWDYQLCLTSFSQSWSNVVPSVNLVSNIGFGPDATHTTAPSEMADLPVRPLSWPIKHPEFFVDDSRFDRLLERHGFGVDADSPSRLELALRGVDERWPDMVEIGCVSAQTVIDFGLHAPETYHDAPLRWASSVAEWIIPLQPPALPTRMSIECFGIAPPSGTDVRLIINGREMTRFRLVGVDHTENIALPDLSEFDILRILLLSTGKTYEGDPRDLGVAIKSMRLHGHI